MAVVEDEKELSSLMIVKKDVTDENRDSKPNEPIEPLKSDEESQQSVTFSSTETEWIALSEAVKDILFLKYLFKSMHIRVQTPITVRVDNLGAVFMSTNVTTSTRTKHVDIRSKFVREYVQDGTIKIIFVRSEENDSDIMTKNLGSLLHSKHAMKLVSEK